MQPPQWVGKEQVFRWVTDWVAPPQTDVTRGAQGDKAERDPGPLSGVVGEATSRKGCLSCRSCRIRRGEAIAVLTRWKNIFWLSGHVRMASTCFSGSSSPRTCSVILRTQPVLVAEICDSSRAQGHGRVTGKETGHLWDPRAGVLWACPPRRPHRAPPMQQMTAAWGAP